jgi:phospholipid N-methyltransferase
MMKRIMATGDRERWLFLRRVLSAPRYVGSVTPSSRYLVEALVQLYDVSKVRTAVELGPGTGPFTEGLLARLPADSRLLCIERDERFADHLRRRFDDPRLAVVTGDAQELERHLADHGLGARVPLIVSGLPFTSLPAEVRESILGAITRCLSPDGAFLLYQYSLAMRTHLLRHFSRVESHWELRNIPPAVCLRCVL